jgi:hypothetical protein
VSYYKSIDYHVKAYCRKCKKEFSDIVRWDFGEWVVNGKRAYRESLGLEEQINKRYSCCDEIVIYYSKQLTGDKPESTYCQCKISNYLNGKCIECGKEITPKENY